MTIDANIIKINKLVDIYLTRSLRGNHYRSRIEEVTADRLVLAMPFDKGLPVFVSTGALIYCKIIAESSPYSFSCQLTEKKMNPLPVWIVSLPTELTKIQLREFVRIDVKLFASVVFIDHEEEMPAAKLLINDISGGGLRVVSSKTYPIGSNVVLTFELPGHEVIETNGQVVRSEQPQSDRTVYWLGIKFIGMREAQRNKIIKYVFQKQLERHRRGF